MRSAVVLCVAGMALGGSSATNSLVTPTIETNSMGVATGVASLITSSSAFTNGTTVLPTSVSNSTATAVVNSTELTSAGSQPTASGTASVSGGSDNTGAAAVMKPMVGVGAAGVVFALLL